MAYIKVNQDKVNKKTAETLIGLCPFNAFEYKDGKLSITSACRVCKICVKNGPEGVCEFVEEAKANLDRSAHKGITVYVEQRHNHPHPVAWELIGKAKELAEISDEPVYALIIGEDVDSIAEEALSYGVDKAFVYENDAYHDFNVERYVNVIETFNETYHPNTILFGGTSEGRSFAPRVAARLKTGLTADCTKLDIRPNGDLLQIRPAFGGNIMAKIHTPAHRPQLATIRHKIFDAPKKTDPFGEIIREDCSDIDTSTRIELLKSTNKPKVKDISEAEIIVAVGRAFKKEKDLQLIKPLVERLHAEVACTRPLIENGWFDPRRQIGLSGRTVKPKLIVNLGISGASEYRIFFQIVMPLVKPAWLTLIILLFQRLWITDGGNFIFSEQMKPVSYALRQIAQGSVERAGTIAAVAFIMMIVPVTFFILSQSRIVETFSYSGMK